MEEFDLIHTPLKGTNLIEAGAGTGKTFAIAGLFLRLILEKELSIDQILVVTYTKAATEELKGRIRQRLLDARQAISRGNCKDDFIKQVVCRQKDVAKALEQIQDALRDFDNTAIFTIHGFCSRILNDHTFETGDLFDSELITDQTPLIISVADDFWRRQIYDAPPELVGFVLASKIDPTYFRRLIEKARHPGIRIIPDPEKPELNHLKLFRAQFIQIKNTWRDARSEVESILKDSSLNASVYGSFKMTGDDSELTYRDHKVATLLAQMDHFIDEETPGPILFNYFKNFTTTKIENSIKKRCEPVWHPFFDLCDDFNNTAERLRSEMEAYITYLKSECLRFAEIELSKRKRHHNVQFFDDLLTMVKKALEKDVRIGLAVKIRRQYHAALVDEFQDIDLVQYEIFSRIFTDKENLLFMIGDPKQAIYSFRGADVFSYLKASSDAGKKHTLVRNFRSDPSLIRAVNAIFSNVKKPFVFNEIGFKKAVSSREGKNRCLEGDAPLKIWLLSDEDGSTYSAGDAVPLIARAVAGEIFRLSSDKTAGIKPGDIAVLVRTNRQAGIVKKYLSDQHIPAVLYSTGNVIDSHEAVEMERILLSIVDPRRESVLKAALATDMLGVKGEMLDPDRMDRNWWESKVADFIEYHRTWNKHGFIRMFRYFIAKEGIRTRLLSFFDGERKLTNVLHLAEILHAAAVHKDLGMTGLLKWFSIQRDPHSMRIEENQLRLESDADAVKIITIHKSKGLEYPIVFCPFTWSRSTVDKDGVAFHDPDAEKRLTLDLGSPDLEAHRILAHNELLAENLRLLYVALTRAKHRCYLVWGRFSTAETSAPAYLFHNLLSENAGGAKTDIVGTMAAFFSDMTYEQFMADMQRLEKKSENTIAIMPLPADGVSELEDSVVKDRKLSLRKFKGHIDTSWRISSYSSLISGRFHDNELPDRDAVMLPTTWSPDVSWHSDQTMSESKDPQDNTIFSFPKGAAAGIFFHDIFENLDLARDDLSYQRKLVTDKLSEHGFPLIWEAPVMKMIANVCSVSLQSAGKPFCLSSIPDEKRIHEMAFFFPLKKIKPSTVKKVFKDHNGHELLDGFPEQLGRLTFSPTRGFMMGYIDMLFEHEDAVYIVDWKSNFLGPIIESYTGDVLRQEMHRSFYILQYHLYALATHLHLHLRNPAYSFEKNFGGVFYIYIRGVDAQKGPVYGIFKDHPDVKLINALGEALVPDYNQYNQGSHLKY